MSESLGLSKEQSKNLMKFISDNISMPVLGAGGGYAPIGTVIMRLSSTAPQGFLLCDGTVYNIKDYPDLATHFASDPEIGSVNAYGGDGIATFAVPDLRGEFIRMCGTNSHTNQGDGSSKIGQHQDSSYIPYLRIDKENNYLAIGVDKDKGYDTPINFEKGFLSKKRYVFNGTTTSGQFVDVDYNTGTIYGIRPTNTSLNFYIKATVAGDANGCVYLPDEHVIGTWTDGSVLYEKTIHVNSISPSQGQIIDGSLKQANVTCRDWSVVGFASSGNNRVKFGDYWVISGNYFKPVAWQHVNGFALAGDQNISNIDATVRYTKNS